MNDTTAISNRVFPETSRRLRLGVWGLGRGLHIAQTAAACHFDVVAGCDYNPHFLEIFRKEIPDGQFTDDAEEFLSWDLDAVLLATYCPSHGPDAIRCLLAGKHVLSEVTAFLTPAEGVALVEAVEATGKVYQLAENYPYTPENRYLKQLWAQGVFGELQYAEFAYLHDCLNYAYTYIDHSPVSPGDQVHNWRSWLPWHHYCTHSLGPVMAITGRRPVRVTSLPGTVRLPGHIMSPPDGLSGIAPSLIEMDNGAIVRNLMGGCTSDDSFNRLFGTRGSSESVRWQLHLHLGGRGESPRLEVKPELGPLDLLAAQTGHGGGDFWVLYHFANEILHGVEPPFDIYRAADVTLPGIQAYRSALAGGAPQEVPDFRDPAVRARYRDDHFRPTGYDTVKGVFAGAAPSPEHQNFTSVMKDLLEQANRWKPFLAWSEIGGLTEPLKVDALAEQALRVLPELRATVARARVLRDSAPGTDGARVLAEVMETLDLALLEAPDAEARLQQRRERVLAIHRQRSLETLWPQLMMKRPDLGNLPPLELPAGYSLRAALPGDEDAPHWCRIIGESFEEERTLTHWHEQMVNRYDYAPERILFLCDSAGEPVATAAAYGGLVEGYVHYVGVVPSALGLGLGSVVSLAVLHAFAARGCRHAILSTDTFRLPAIKTYWKLGFRPWITDPTQPDRWRDVAEKLKLPALAQDWICEKSPA